MSSKIKKSIFSNNIDFFKSNSLEENGMLKSIPTMPVKEYQERIEQKRKEIPVEVIQFKQKVQNQFKDMDELIKECVTEISAEKMAEALTCYSKFKRELQSVLNDFINYPEQKSVSDESDWDKSRIKITK